MVSATTIIIIITNVIISTTPGRLHLDLVHVQVPHDL